MDTTDKDVHLKALKNALVSCSSKLKKAVDRKNLLAHSKLPIAAADLHRMVAAARIGNKRAVSRKHDQQESSHTRQQSASFTC